VEKTALEGLKGATKVERSWENFKKINSVYYAPDLIAIEEMEAAFEKAGTYRGTVK